MCFLVTHTKCLCDCNSTLPLICFPPLPPPSPPSPPLSFPLSPQLFMRSLELIHRANVMSHDNYHNVFGGYMEELYSAHEQFWSWTLLPCLEQVPATAPIPCRTRLVSIPCQTLYRQWSNTNAMIVSSSWCFKSSPHSCS